MSRKTRKLMWSAPLVAALAVVGALAAFIALAPHAAQAQDSMVYGPPTGLTATADGQTVIELTWEPPASGTVTAYRVDMSDDGMVWEELVAANPGVPDTFYDHGNLDPGDTKHYRVFAIYGTKGAGEPSETAMATTDPPMPPGKPMSLTLTAGSANDQTDITMEWVAPTSNGGFPITGYKIERSKDDNNWMTVEADTGLTDDITADCASGSECSYTDGMRRNKTKYYYRVSAINKFGTGMPTDSESHTTAVGTTGPVAPTGLTAQGSNSQVTLLWLAPDDPAGSPITHYVVERAKDSTDTDEDPVEVAKMAPLTSHTVGGAFSGGTTPWHYRVKAVSFDGNEGLETEWLTVGPPDASTHGAVQSLRARTKLPLSVELSWREGPGITDDDTFRIDYSLDNRVWKALVESEDIDKDETRERYIYLDEELKAGEMRYYRVIAVSDTDDVLHQVSNVVSAVPGAPNKPGKPTDLAFTTTPPTANTITMEWVAPTDTGGSPITGYKIERSSDNKVWMTLKADTGLMEETDPDDSSVSLIRTTTDCASGTECIYTDKDLVAATTYHYRVSARNAGGPGDPGDSDSAKTMAAGAPGIPSGLVAVSRGTSQVDLYWVSPGDSDGAPMTGYKVEVSVDDGTTWTTVVADTMSRTTMYSHTRLTGDDTRTYRVSAISSVGLSAPSETDTTMAGGAAQPTTMLMAPTNVDATVSGSDVTITWTDGENAARHAVILFTDDYEIGGRIQGNPSGNSVTFSNVPSGDYIAVVVALDSAGDDFRNMEIGFDMVTVP